MMGWKCPGCGSCYGPHVDECRRCAPPQFATGTTCLHPEVVEDTSGTRCKFCGMKMVSFPHVTITSVGGTMLQQEPLKSGEVVGQLKYYGRQPDGTLLEFPGWEPVQSTELNFSASETMSRHEGCEVCEILKAEDEVAFRNIDVAVEGFSDS